MPGLVGVIGTGPLEDRQREVRSMLSCVSYEDFYLPGLHFDQGMAVFVGWTCHRDGPFAHLPVSNVTRDVFLFFSGEIFPSRELSSFGPESLHHGSAVLDLYEESGTDFVHRLNGLFAGLLVDARQAKAYLFNDRFGMHRMFVHQGRDAFYFASEAKALLAILPETRAFDPASLAEFLTCGCPLGTRSLFSQVSLLPPASLWTVGGGKIAARRVYFDRGEWLGQEPMGEDAFVSTAVDAFGDFAKRYACGPLSVGISLTGGLDSRIVMACLGPTPLRFPCYTFGSMYRDTFDVKVARQVAATCNQNYEVLVLGQEFLGELPNHLERSVFISDGYLGLSGAAELYLNSLARRLAPVRLTGNYGSEILRGARAFKYHIPRGDYLDPGFLPFVDQARIEFAEQDGTDPVSYALFHQAPSQGAGRLAIERSQLVLRTPFFDNDLASLTYRAPRSVLSVTRLSESIITRYNPALLDLVTDRGFLGGRNPFMQAFRRIHRQSLFKGEYWVDHGLPSWLGPFSRLRVPAFLRTWLTGQHKFQHFGKWVREPLRAYVRDTLLHSPVSEVSTYFRMDRVEKMLETHLTGEANYIDEIDMVLTVALASHVFFRQRDPRVTHVTPTMG